MSGLEGESEISDEIGMRLLRIGFHILIAGALLASAGCQSPDAKGVASPAPVKQEQDLEKYTYSELFAAGELLHRVVSNPSEFPTAEGEANFACRLESESAARWLQPLRTLIEHRQSQERDAYLKDPVGYQRSAGFERCGPRCSCGALTAVLKSVKLKDLKSPQLRSFHRESLRRLNVKAARLDPDEQYACLQKTEWFCASDLRDALEREGPNLRKPSSNPAQ